LKRRNHKEQGFSINGGKIVAPAKPVVHKEAAAAV
jgi:hypothetical protein